MWATGVRTASDLVPASLQATGQGLFSLTYSSLGNGVGFLVFGIVYQHLGPLWAFRAWSFLCVGIVAVSIVVYFIYRLSHKSKNVQHQQIPSDDATDGTTTEGAEPPTAEAELEQLSKSAH